MLSLALIALLPLVAAADLVEGRHLQGGFPGQSKEAAAQTARWVVHEADWGYVTTLKDGAPTAQVLSFSDGAPAKSTGRLFFYLMGGEGTPDTFPASVTISQESLNMTRGCALDKIDPEDPRCAKLTIAGTMTKSTGDDQQEGHAALIARHPQMAKWPVGHGFMVYELKINDLWMIDFYGGGGIIAPADYMKATPTHNVPKWPPSTGSSASVPSGAQATDPPPPANHTAARARWLVYHSIWTSVGTVSVRLNGHPWGNVRSIADGVGANSTGVPVLYLPTPDPTAIDVDANPHVSLSFSEAALPDRVVPKGVCGGMDPEDPTCARLHMIGTLRALTSKAELAQAMTSLGARHPYAPWLGKGGAHTGGKYYTIEIESLMFLDFYGGPAHLTPQEYRAAAPPTARK